MLLHISMVVFNAFLFAMKNITYAFWCMNKLSFYLDQLVNIRRRENHLYCNDKYILNFTSELNKFYNKVYNLLNAFYLGQKKYRITDFAMENVL